MKVYLCGPINGCTDEECNDWRSLVKELLGGIETIDPMRRDYRGKEDVAYVEIVEGDKLDVDESDVVLVSYSKPSVGTSMEMLYAWQQHKPVLVVHKRGAVLSPWLVYHSTKRVLSYEDAAKWILKAHAG